MTPSSAGSIIDVGGALRDRCLESFVEKSDLTDYGVRVVVHPVRDRETQLPGGPAIWMEP